MRGDERGDYQAWLDWAAFGIRAPSNAESCIKLEEFKKTDTRASVCLPAVDSRGKKHSRKLEVFVEPREKQRRFMSYQRNVSHAVTGKRCPEFLVKDLGYSVDTLRFHLERQFSARMSWENYAGNLPFREKQRKWHIDHIIPKSRFREDLESAFALSNLRPLWESENIRKGISRTFLV